MVEAKTFAGKYYVVTSPNGCTVTSNSGKALGSVEAGKQGFFTAIDSRIVADDPDAEVTPVFKLAPQQKLALLGVLGGNGGGQSAGVTRVSYLMSTGTQHIIGESSQLLSNDSFEVRAQAALPGNPAVSATAISSTVFSLSNNVTLWVPYNYNNNPRNIRWDFLGDGNGQHYTEYDGVYEFSTYKKRGGHCYIDGKLVLSKNSNRSESAKFGLFNRIGGTSFNRGGQIAWVKIGEPGNEKLHLVAAVDENGSPCMYDLVSKTAYLNTGSGAFVVGVDTQAQLNAVLRKLPDLTGQDGRELHLCLADSLYESAVASGIIEAAATSKNWQIAYDPTTKLA